VKNGDLVRFKHIVGGRWRIGLLIEYTTWEKVGTVLYHGKTYRIRAENMQKAGKKDESR